MMVVYDVCSLYSLYIIGCYKLDLDTDCCEGYMTVNAGYIPDGHKAQDALYIYIYIYDSCHEQHREESTIVLIKNIVSNLH